MRKRDALLDRLEDGSPLRLGELARFLGYSREHLRKLANCGVLRTVVPHRRGAHRRVPTVEAERLAREMGVI